MRKKTKGEVYPNDTKNAYNAGGRGMYHNTRSFTRGGMSVRTAQTKTERRKREGCKTRNYQRKRNNNYWLPDDVYRRALAHVRAYPQLCARRDEIIFSSPAGDGPHGSGVGNPTESKALQLDRIEDDIAAVDRALSKVPPEYRQGLIDNIAFNRPMYALPGACVDTWSRWRSVLLWSLSRNMRWI